MYERIRNLREDKDYTQKHIADELKVSQKTYSDYELGKLNIPISALKILARYFDTSIDYLVGLTDRCEPYPPAKEK